MQILAKLQRWLRGWFQPRSVTVLVPTVAEPPQDVPMEPTSQPEPIPKRHYTWVTAERRATLRKLAKHRVEIADTVDLILTRLTNLERTRTTIGNAEVDELAGEMLGCDYHFFDDNGPIGGEDFVGHEMAWFNPTIKGDTTLQELVDMFWPIDTAHIVRKENRFHICHKFTVTPAEVRGKVKFVVPKMIRSVFGDLRDDGTWWLDDGIYGFVGGKWRAIDGIAITARHSAAGHLMGYRRNNTENANDIANETAMTFSNLLTQRYYWHVALGPTRDGPRILMPTSPHGCRELFKDRDLEEGRQRRRALRHWVTRHYREMGDVGISFIRQHLRGATDFRWANLAGEVMVSQLDLERNEEFKREADKWRAERKSNRFKVKLRKKV